MIKAGKMGMPLPWTAGVEELQLLREVGETGVLWKVTLSNLGVGQKDGDGSVKWKPASRQSDSI